MYDYDSIPMYNRLWPTTRRRRQRKHRHPHVCSEPFLCGVSKLESYRKEQHAEDMRLILSASGLEELNLTATKHL